MAYVYKIEHFETENDHPQTSLGEGTLSLRQYSSANSGTFNLSSVEKKRESLHHLCNRYSPQAAVGERKRGGVDSLPNPACTKWG